MKKVLSVLIAVAMLAAVCSIGINAESINICTHHTGDVCGGYVSDADATRLYHYGNAYTFSANYSTTAELYAHGRNYLDQASAGAWSDVTSPTYEGSAFAYYTAFQCSHSAY